MIRIKKLYAAAAAVLVILSGGCSSQSGHKDSVSDTAGSTAEVSAEAAENVSEALPMRDISSAELIKEMHIGWNIGNTLDAVGTGLSSETAWGCPKVTQEQIDAVKEKGFDVIRIPVTWTGHIDEEGNIDPFWMDRVNEVVDYCVDDNTFAILNVHHEEWNHTFADNKDRAVETEIKLWTQIADRFRNYDEHLIFEAQNEPRKVGTNKEWTDGDAEAYEVINAVNSAFYETVRSSGGNNDKRHLMLPSYAAKFSDAVLQSLALPEDDKVIVSVHAYIPYNFALNTAGTDKFSSEKSVSTAEITYMLESLENNLLSKGRAVIIGETGAMNKDNLEYRVDWADYFISETKKHGVPCVLWDNFAFSSGETFGLLDRRTLEWKYPELMDAFMNAAYGKNEE